MQDTIGIICHFGCGGEGRGKGGRGGDENRKKGRDVGFVGRAQLQGVGLCRKTCTRDGDG